MPARVFLIRHGETNWTQGGKFTSRTEVPLSKDGENQLLDTRNVFLGKGKLIDPENVVRIYCSPRGRARRSAEILDLGAHYHQYFCQETGEVETTTKPPEMAEVARCTIQLTSRLDEWGYGEYEGLTIREVSQRREENGEKPWRIWDDGCPGGESPDQVRARVDSLIKEIREIITSTAATWPGGRTVTHVSLEPRNVVCVGHGHTLAALAMRWVGQPLTQGFRLLFDPAGIAILGFEHDDLEEPAILLGRRPQPSA